MPDVLDALIADTVDRQDDLTLFPLATDAPAQKPESLRKFLNVDLETVLPQIMKQKTAFYQTDLNYALDAMREGATSGDPAKQNFVLIFRQSGVECLNERDMFIGGTRSFNTLQFYHTQTREPVLTYSVELTGTAKTACGEICTSRTTTALRNTQGVPPPLYRCNGYIYRRERSTAAGKGILL